jgi:hypothetical protein
VARSVLGRLRTLDRRRFSHFASDADAAGLFCCSPASLLDKIGYVEFVGRAPCPPFADCLILDLLDAGG